MRLESTKVGNAVIQALTNAIRVRVASAFFCPGSKTLDVLNTVADLTLIISEEFTINDPAKLEKLSNANKRSVPPDSKDGKLPRKGHHCRYGRRINVGADWIRKHDRVGAVLQPGSGHFVHFRRAAGSRGNFGSGGVV